MVQRGKFQKVIIAEQLQKERVDKKKVSFFRFDEPLPTQVTTSEREMRTNKTRNRKGCALRVK